MAKTKNKSNHVSTVLLFLLWLGGLLLLIAKLLHGKNVALFNPKGLIAQQQHSLMVLILGVLLTVTIFTLLVLFFVAWKYSESNTKTVHVSVVRSSKFLVLSMWLFPTLVMVLLASVMIPATHKLAPRNPIASDAKPLTIQVISMRWKWLFIYPEQNIATVNFVQVPVDTPITFELTADEAPMSSFWIPNLGGQLYAMTGHVNQLNLIANKIGSYPGSSAELNGNGFAGMKFIAQASSKKDFEQWVQSVRASSNVLNSDNYENLLVPSENNPALTYSATDAGLYDKVLMKYTGSHHNVAEHE